MSSAKRRKMNGSSSRNLSSLTKSITAFAKVSKAQAISKSIYDKKHLLDATVTTGLDKGDRKRKLVFVEEVVVDTSSADQASIILSAALCQSERAIKVLPQRTPLQKVPQRNATSKSVSPASNEVPTKAPQSQVNHPAVPSLSPAIIVSAAEALPIEIRDLLDLHASFLTALSLHHAHNGTQSPADLRVLCPDVARAWGKRRVGIEDIRRILGVFKNSEVSSALTLSDYGQGKICVETKAIRGKMGARPLKEDLLNDAFAHELRSLWDKRTECVDSVSNFIKALPLEDIKICPSLAKMSPLLAKGQRRLEDLKAGIILKKQAEKETPNASLMKTEDGVRKPSLLERLRAKQLQKASLPPPPSKTELARRAAFDRVEEVVSVLSLLTTSTSIGQSRVSYTMPTVLGKLRDSCQNPMSKEEGETCVRLLAFEIAPEWLRVVKMGKVDAVIVVRENRPSDLDVQERVKRAV